MMHEKINEGFTRRELRVLDRAGFAATLWERRSGGWSVGLYDNQAPDNDAVTFADGDTRISAIQAAITEARKLPRCPCGGILSARWCACVRCGREERQHGGFNDG